MNSPTSTPEPVDELTEAAIEAISQAPFPSYQWPLDLARRHVRSGDLKRIGPAVALLRKLRDRYPQALAVGQELIFALIESGKAGEAEATKVLIDLERTFPNLDMELLCRWGRLFKDKGDAHSGSRWVRNPGTKNVPLAIAYYQQSIAKYAQAYRLDEHYYPGINEASLILIVAALESPRPGTPPALPPKAAELAEKVDKAPSLLVSGSAEDEKVWKPATRGEACLLVQDWVRASGYYSEAISAGHHLTPQARESMSRQVHRITEAFATFGVTPAAPFDQKERIDDFFGMRPAPAPAPAPPPTA